MFLKSTLKYNATQIVSFKIFNARYSPSYVLGLGCHYKRASLAASSYLHQNCSPNKKVNPKLKGDLDYSGTDEILYKETQVTMHTCMVIQNIEFIYLISR